MVLNQQQTQEQSQPPPKMTLSVTGFISLNSAMLNPPFYTNAFKLDNSGITLEIKNNGGETYNLRNIEISNCGSQYIGKNINVNEMMRIIIPCSIDKENYKGDITLYYSK